MAAVIAFMPAWSFGDDRDLLDGRRAKPNVLVILGSGASMTHDVPSSNLWFPADGDDDGRYAAFMERFYGADFLRRSVGPNFMEVLEQGSKMHQAKAALSHLIDRGSALNIGFSYFENDVDRSSRVNFIYTVGTDQPEMLDGSLPGDPIRMGVEGSSTTPYRSRYGENGDRIFVAETDPFGINRGSPTEPHDGDLRLVSFLVDSPGDFGPRPWSEIAMEERTRRRLFFHPSYDFFARSLNGWIRKGLLGLAPWRSVARGMGIDIEDETWQEVLRDRVTDEIQGYPIGSRTLWVFERYEVYRNALGWIRTRPGDCRSCPVSRITRVEYSQHIVIGGPVAEGEPQPGPGTMVPDDGRICRGLVNGDDGLSPVVPISTPDEATGETVDNGGTIGALLSSESSSVFFFPSRLERRVLPASRADYLPLTQTVEATGSRPLAESLREAGVYFERTVDAWNDPFERCRRSFIILITDGDESCEDPQAVCLAVTDLRTVPVFVVLLGTDDGRGVPSSLECVASTSGGRLYEVEGENEIRAVLEDIVQDIEQRSHAFTSPILPPSGAHESRTAFLTTFRPRRGRSIWEGHLTAYRAESVEEVFNGDVLPLWDAGNILATRWDWGDVVVPSPFGTSVDPRSMYYGVMEGGRGRRRAFASPGDDARSFGLRRELGGLIFGRWPETTEAERGVDRARLRNTVNFMRGVAVGSDETGRIVALRDPDLYGWCGADVTTHGGQCSPGEQPLGLEKLGDIFHSSPQRMSYPSCYSCFRTDLHDYRDFFLRNRHRRTVLFVGANDGAMHGFDGGLWGPSSGERANPGYDVGSGRELFAWIPRSVMGEFSRLAGTSSHLWTVDGTPTLADVWVDPDCMVGPCGDHRQWRTLLLWGQRRGGRSYVCLDVTEPDPLGEDGEPLPPGAASGSVPAASSLREAGCRDAEGVAGCSHSWPLFRWEFTDQSDEDHNGAPDLGLTWSRPAVAFVRVIQEDEPEERMVAFFGGGLSQSSSAGVSSGVSGNFIYGLDVETGQILFKASVDGMAPGDVQLLDFDSDGFVEKLFFGTTAGKVYRVDLEDPGILDPGTGRVLSWRPEVIFTAGPDQPFFVRPTLVPAFVDPEGNAHLAVLIGSGNRDDLLEANRMAHRFYVFLDGGGDALLEEDLVEISPRSAALGVPLLGPEGGAGWYLKFDGAGSRREKVVTSALVLQGTVVFSTFSPDGAGRGRDACRSAGGARTYVVSLMNGDPMPGKERYEEYQAPTVLAGDARLVIDGDGSIRVFQVSDDLQLKEPLMPAPVTVGLVDWREE